MQRQRSLTRTVRGVAMLLSLLTALSACSTRPNETDAQTQQVTLRGRTFQLELALDPETRYQGLSDRESIAADGGMLFVFPRARPLEFVMRRCLVPIDLIYISPAGRIVKMHEMQVEPPDVRDDEERLRRYPSDWPAQFAIELKGGTIRELGLRPGEKVELPYDDLKARAR